MLEDEIFRCEMELKYLSADLNKFDFKTKKDLIISTGDISDVDGMFALVKYAKSGADVLFVMNYPAYLMKENNENYDEVSPGLGFGYGALQFFTQSRVNLENKIGQFACNMFHKNMSKYFSRDGYVLGYKRALTDLAFNMVVSVWNEVQVDYSEEKGSVYFCVGGINSINPFSASTCKNELYVYRELMAGVHNLDSIQEGCIFETSGKQVSCPLVDLLPLYSRIFLDFNGSAAFFNENWGTALSVARSRLKGMFVMGGVHSYDISRTMPRVVNQLNRFSCATMNQLYHPEKSASLFLFMCNAGIPVFVISNNSVSPYETYSVPLIKNNIGWQSFLISNCIANSVVLDRQTCCVLGSSYLWRLADMYYNSIYNPPRKPFDYYTALALSQVLSDGTTNGRIIGDRRILFYDAVFGITMLSKPSKTLSWTSEFSQYLLLADRSSPARINGLAVEESILREAQCEKIPVFLVRFKSGDISDYRLVVLAT